MGIIGVQNLPVSGLIDADSRYRHNLEESGFGFNKEVEMLKLEHKWAFSLSVIALLLMKQEQ